MNIHKIYTALCRACLIYATVAPYTYAAPALTPSEINQQFGTLFAARDLDGLVQLFEKQAIMKPSPDKPFVQGHAAIRETLATFLNANTNIEVLKTDTYENGDVAIKRSKWRISGETPSEGEAIELLRRQEDGSWRYVIDMPFGF